MMTVLILAAVLSFAPGRGDTGLGFIVGNPTGLSFKHYTSTTTAIDAAAAWSFSSDWMLIHSDYLWHSFGAIDVDKGQMPLYYGLGGWVAFGEDDVHAGGRVPLGIEYLFARNDIGAFLEVAAGLSVIPDTDFHLDAAIGIRFYF
jgi:hypothetical protein